MYIDHAREKASTDRKDAVSALLHVEEEVCANLLLEYEEEEQK